MPFVLSSLGYFVLSTMVCFLFGALWGFTAAGVAYLSLLSVWVLMLLNYGGSAR